MPSKRFAAAALWAFGMAASAPAAAAIDFERLVGADQSVRQQEAEGIAQAQDAKSLIALWLLAHDPAHEVVGAALRSALLRCRHEPFDVCQGLLAFFITSEMDDAPEAFRARMALLAEQPQLARAYASRETKLDVVALLAGRLGEGGGPQAYRSALELLARDPEPDVQEAAGAVLLQLER